MRVLKLIAAIFSIVLLVSCRAQIPGGAAENGGDILIEGGIIYTGRDVEPAVEALVIKDGLIIYAGDRRGASAYIGNATKTVDLKSGMATPGFVDAHVHLAAVGAREFILNLDDLASIGDLIAAVEKEVEKASRGDTIVGVGWIETHWPEGRAPTRWDIDAVSPDNPVILFRRDAHALLVNSAGLKAAGVDESTAAPEGGRLVREETGRLTGLLIDAAMGLVAAITPDPIEAPTEKNLVRGGEFMARNCWTGVHNMSSTIKEDGTLRDLAAQGRLRVRVYNVLGVSSASAEAVFAFLSSTPRAHASGFVTTRAIKVVADGALGSRGAALFKPYADDPNNRGLMLIKPSDIITILKTASQAGLQVATHAIGPRANRAVLDWYSQVFEESSALNQGDGGPRWRIEHAQVLSPQDIPRFHKLGVIASMQPSHAISDLHFASKRLGVQRLQGAYAWRSLIESGAIIAGGSDAPVEQGSAVTEFYAAVVRKDLSGRSMPHWRPQEAVDRRDALKMFTLWPAYAAFDEHASGVLDVGKRADISVFSSDLMRAPADALPSVRCDLTIVDGKIAYQRSG